MRVAAIVAGVVLIALVLWETFETLVLPRRVARRLRLTRISFRVMWRTWSAIGRRHPGPRRENYLGVFGPLSLIMIFGLWAFGLMLGFALTVCVEGIRLSSMVWTVPTAAMEIPWALVYLGIVLGTGVMTLALAGSLWARLRGRREEKQAW